MGVRGFGLGIARVEEKTTLIDGLILRDEEGKFTYLTGERYLEPKESGVQVSIIDGEEFIGVSERELANKGLEGIDVNCIITGNGENKVATFHVEGMNEGMLLRANYVQESDLFNLFYTRITVKEGEASKYDITMDRFIPLGDLLHGTDMCNVEAVISDLSAQGGLEIVMPKVMEQVVVFNMHLDEGLYGEGNKDE